MDDNDVEIRERLFHNAVRQYIIFLLVFIILYVSSYFFLTYFKKKTICEDHFSGEKEDAIVYRISLWMCTFTLSSSLGAALLLPISIISNELLLHYTNSYYMQWLNSSLIEGLWNWVSLFSNLSLLILMPFAYLFTEAEGLPGCRKGIMSRVYETALVLSLIAIMACGLTFIFAAVFNKDEWSKRTLFDVWSFYLPYIYSCISLIGVLLLFICTPLGFVRMFTLLGKLVKKPAFLRKIDDELYTTSLEQETLRRHLNFLRHSSSKYSKLANGNNESHSVDEYKNKLNELDNDYMELERRRWLGVKKDYLRIIIIPILFAGLVGLTAVCGLLVLRNTLELIIGTSSPAISKNLVLGAASFSRLGLFGSTLYLLVILYVTVSSIVGLYCLPYISPKLMLLKSNTSTTKLIGNCSLWLIISSAMPLLARTLGFTDFHPGTPPKWLHNIVFVTFYNMAFLAATTFCLVTRLSSAARKSIMSRVRRIMRRKNKNE